MKSPFPTKNRPIFQSTIGSMSSSQIKYSLPRLKAAVEAINSLQDQVFSIAALQDIHS